MRGFLDAKYENPNLNKVMTKQCQHTIATDHYILLNILNKFEDIYAGMLGM